jgi:2-polyprenyl-3-methyl-5-hydroxy-6-metoxy-1,4-benzoquinol methylase
MHQQVDPENFEAWNEAMGRKYDPDAYHHHPSPFVRFVEKRRVDALLNYLGSTEGKRILEIGCGSGNILEQINGAELHGIDLSDHLLEKARARLGDRAVLVKGNAECLPYEAGSMDRVICTEVLEHVLNPRQVIQGMRRVLRSDGFAVVSVPNEMLINTLKKYLMGNMVGRLLLAEKKDSYKSSTRMDDEWHLHSFDLPMLHDVISGIFTVEHLSSIPWPGLPIRYVAKLRPTRHSL